MRVAFPRQPLLARRANQGRRRAYHVPPLSLCGLGRASPPVAQRAAPEEFGTSGLDHVPFGPSVSASCRLAFVTTFSSASPELTNTTPSWFPTPLMLGVAALASRPWLPFAEGGYVVAGASHATVSRDARPGGILRAAPQVMSLRREHDSNSDDFVSHPNEEVQQRRPAGETSKLGKP